MLAIDAILRTVRVAVHDTDAITYDDNEIVAVLNAGFRFIRRTIIELQPEILAETVAGELVAGEDVIQMDVRPAAIVEVTAGDEVKRTDVSYSNDKIYHNYNLIYHNRTPIYSRVERKFYKEEPLLATNLRHAPRNEEGRPTAFYRTGTRTIHLVPVPQKTTAYTVRYVRDLDELTIHDVSPLLTEFDDFLIEYATIRLSIGNEYDVSQEQVVMGNIISQIRQMLFPPPPGIRTRGYWELPVKRGGW